MVLKLSGEMKELKICPRCKKAYSGYPAISRRDNKTEICSECGQAEAFEDLFGYLSKEE